MTLHLGLENEEHIIDMSTDATTIAQPTIDLTEFEAPSHVGKYEIHEEVGRGTCGVVYKGFDPFVQRDVAIKIALNDPTVDPDTTRQNQRTFFSEAHAAGKLQHPHIVSLFDAGMEAELAYIVMEFVPGETMLDHCKAGVDALTVQQIVDAMFKCAKALDYSHRRGVLHRDIKPSNIMYSDDGSTKIMDFSIAEVTQNTLFTPDSVVGSPLYMSPEQVQQKELGPSSDLYSLGAVMYQLLAGQPPFYSDNVLTLFHDIVNTTTPSLAIHRPDLPSYLCDIVDKCLSKDPKERFETGAQLAEQLLRLFDNLRFTNKQISKRENRDALKDLNFFNEFSDDEVDEILAASKMISYEPGSVIIQEGDIDSSFYIIAVGEAEVLKSGKLIQVLGKGDCLGEIGFLTRTRRTATILAKKEVLALKVSASQMERVSKDCQLRYYKVFCETLIYRLSVTSAKLSSLV